MTQLETCLSGKQEDLSSVHSTHLKVGDGCTAHSLVPAPREVRQEDLSGLLARYSIKVIESSRPMRDLVKKN